MKDLEILLNEIMPTLTMEHEEFGSNKTIQLDFTQKIGDFMDLKLSKDPEVIIELIKKVPYSIFLIEFDPKKPDSNVFFEKAFNALLNPDRDFALSFKQNSTFMAYLNSSFSLKWFEMNKVFLTKEIFLSIKGNLSRKSSFLLKEIVHLFAEKYSNHQEFLLDLHNVYSSNDRVNIPDSIISQYSQHIDTVVFNQLSSKIFKNMISYYSENSQENQVKKYFKDFITDESIALYLKNNENDLESYQYKNLFVEYSEYMSDETFNDSAKKFLVKAYDLDSKYPRQTSDFKYLPVDIRDRMALLALETTPWAYMNLSENKRVELMHKVNFKEKQGLLAVHPRPNIISNDDWIEALKESKFKLKSAPSFLFTGKRALTQNDWFDIFSYEPKVTNVHFSYLAKEHRKIISEDLLERLSTLIDHPVRNKEMIKSYIARKNTANIQKDTMEEIMKVAKLKDEKKLAAQITKMFSIGLGTKENMEQILKTFKGD